MKVYLVTYNGNRYTTVAKSPEQAIAHVRYRQELLFAPMSAFRATEVNHG